VAESALVVSEIPAHEHDADYINDGGGEVDAADDFGFASSTFVSNLDADKVDGKDSAELMMPGIPEGSIIMWSGVVDGNGHPLVDGTPDTNWYICNGANGTPDLRNRFLIGAGGSYSIGDTGGSTSSTLTEDNLPSHNHSISATTDDAGLHVHTYYNWAANWNVVNAALIGGPYAVTVNLSGNNIESLTDLQPDHWHNVSGTTSSVGNGQSFSIMPPYYALAFIMYVPD
jgi:microcystin-dependent protein